MYLREENVEKFLLNSVVDNDFEPCPTLVAILRGALCLSQDKQHLVVPTIGAIICMISYLHRPVSMGAFQKLKVLNSYVVEWM